MRLGLHCRALCLALSVLGWMAYEAIGGNHAYAQSAPSLLTSASAVGSDHVTAQRSNGTLVSWGWDREGQLGSGRALARSTLQPVLAVDDIVSVASSYNHNLAIRRNGTVVAWGFNDTGQLGNGSTLDSSVPVPVKRLTNVVGVAAGYRHSLAVTADGAVWGWGRNEFGSATGVDPSDMRPIGPANELEPIRVNGLPRIVAVATLPQSSLALDADGFIWVWGSKSAGQLGAGVIPFDQSQFGLPVAPERASISGVAAICGGPSVNMFALKRDGTVWTWANLQFVSYGTAPRGSIFGERTGTPTQVPNLPPIRSLACGAHHVAVVDTTGSVWGWGRNQSGELGFAATAQDVSFREARRMPGIANAESVAVGARRTLVRFASGAVIDVGGESRATVSGLPPIRHVAAGAEHIVLTAESGAVFAAGSDVNGQLGAGAKTNQTVPVDVVGLSDVIAIASVPLRGLAASSVALKRDGTVWTWGEGQSSPRRQAGLDSIKAVSAGAGYFVALRTDGTLWIWYGVAGGVPTQLTGFPSIAAISTHWQTTLAVSTTGEVWAYGFRAAVAADGRLLESLTPVKVPGLTNVASVAAGSDYHLAIRVDGSVWDWGETLTGRRLPSAIPGLSNIRFGTTAQGPTVPASSLFIDAQNRLWMIGRFAYDALPADLAALRAPRQIAGLPPVVGVASSGLHTVVIAEDRSVLAWGTNTQGQLGDGTFSFRAKPAVVNQVGGAGTLATNDWFLDLDPAVAKRTPQEELPAFQIVSESFGANVNATLRARPADIGTVQNAYVFALAPASIVKGAEQKGGAAPDDPASLIRLQATPTDTTTKNTGPLGCVLAQLGADGTLTAVSAANLQAFISGVLTAGGTAVTVLNNISASAIQGSTFYVGYGTSGTSMINSGLNRSVASIPGSSTCQPQAPQTGWWWNKDEGGRGYSIEARGTNLFWAGFLYDPSGRSSWMVAPGPTALDGALFQATLYSVENGQTLAGAYRPPAAPKSEGLITLSFATATQGTLIWPWGTLPIERLAFVPNGLTTPPQAFQPESGWWWNASESGRGFFIEWQAGFANVVGYMYDESGKPVWYISVYPTADPKVFDGSWWVYGNGQTLGGPYKPAAQLTNNFAPLSIRFTDSQNATMTLPGGKSLAITRFKF